MSNADNLDGTALGDQLDRVMAGLTDRWDDNKSYLRRPVQWCEDRLGQFEWSRQVDILESVRDNRYTAVHSAHELGKSKVAADAVSWWIDAHPIGDAFVISTAPTAAQVSAILWREINKDFATALDRDMPLPGKINRAGYPQWYHGGELIGYGRKPADYDDSAFQGIHARYVLVVIDEACGVPRHLYEAIDSIVANEHSRVLAIGNPDDPGSYFGEVCKPGSGWNVIHLDALRSPNMNAKMIIGDDPSKPKYPLTKTLMEAEGIPYSTESIPSLLSELLVSPLWVEERIQRWAGFADSDTSDGGLGSYDPEELARLVQSRCAESPIFASKVRGIFPSSKIAGVIPLGWVELAINRWRDWNDAGADTSKVANPSRHVVGVDVAYGGEDETVMAPRYGETITKLHRYRLADTVETADYAAMLCTETGSLAVVDVIGIGAGVYDTLRRYRAENRILSSVMPFNASAATIRRDAIGQFRFRNDRAAAWWNLRQLLDPSRGHHLALPDDERLKEELVAVRWKLMAGGIIQVESKDDIRGRLKRSTDSADAVVQAFWPDAKPFDSEPPNTGYPTNRQPSNTLTYAGHDPYTTADLQRLPGLGAPSGNAELIRVGAGGHVERGNPATRPDDPNEDVLGGWRYA